MEAFGSRLRTIREFKGLDLKEAAADLALNYHTLQKYELGLREPPLYLLIRFSRYYEVSVDDLLSTRTFKDDRLPYMGRTTG